jgi:hypothetical protein
MLQQLIDVDPFCFYDRAAGRKPPQSTVYDLSDRFAVIVFMTFKFKCRAPCTFRGAHNFISVRHHFNYISRTIAVVIIKNALFNAAFHSFWHAADHLLILLCPLHSSNILPVPAC